MRDELSSSSSSAAATATAPPAVESAGAVDSAGAGQDGEVLVLRLEADGVLRREGARVRTARRWQGAMARAAFHLRAVTGDGDDLRVPIVHALIELYPEASDDELVQLVRVMLPIECAELPGGS